MYPFNKKRGVGLKGSMNYGEVARRYMGLLMENRDFFCCFYSTFLYVLVLSSRKCQSGHHTSRYYLQIGSRIKRCVSLAESTMKTRKVFSEWSHISSTFHWPKLVTCPSLNQSCSKGIGCPWWVQTRVHIHWFRQVRIYLLRQVT